MTATLIGQRQRLGVEVCSPLFATPRNPSRQTLGHLVAEVAERLGKPLYLWQRDVADVVMEIDPDTGQLFYSELVMTVPRQAGKTTFVLVLLVCRLTVMSELLGLQNALYTAQSGTKAREKLQRDFAKALRVARASFSEISASSRKTPTKPSEWKLSMVNGSEHILFGIGNYLGIAAPTEDAGHGGTLDMGVIDEAFAHETDIVEQGIEPTMQTRDSAQMVIISTAGTEKSKYLYRKVLAGRERCQSGEHGSSAYFEWGIPEDEDHTDERVWHRYHPNVSNPNVLRSMRAKLQKAMANPDDPESGMDAFRRGYCNQWPNKPVLEVDDKSTIKLTLEAWGQCGERPDTWDQAKVAEGQPVVLAVSAPTDRSTASLVMAGYRADGLVHVEEMGFDGNGDPFTGVSWLKEALPRIVKAWGNDLVTIAIDPKDPAASVVAEVEAALGQKLQRVTLERFGAACVDFVDMVHECRIRHRGEFVFSDAVAGLRTRRIGDGSLWLWDRQTSKTNPAPIVAATLAVYALPAAVAAQPKPVVSFAY